MEGEVFEPVLLKLLAVHKWRLAHFVIFSKGIDSCLMMKLAGKLADI